MKPILIIAIGNLSRGDDALGPALLQQIGDWLTTQQLSDQYDLLEEYQLQIENVTDLFQRRLVLFIDAALDLDTPFQFQQIHASPLANLYSHALDPDALLHVYRDFYKQNPPASFVLAIKGLDFELGANLSHTACRHLQAAFEFIKPCLLETELDYWQQQQNLVHPL